MLTLRQLELSRRAAFRGYAIAVLSVAAAVLTLHVMDRRWQDSAPVSTFLIAVITSSWLGGTRPGLLAAALSLLGFDYYFLGLPGSPADIPVQAVRLLSFALVAFYVVWITATERGAAESLRRAHDGLQRSNDALRAENLAVRKSERVLREAEELGHTGSWEHDLITGEIFNTAENLRLFFGDDRTKGANFEDYVAAIHPEDRAYVTARHEQLLEQGGPRDIEYRVVWPDGSVHTLVGRATVVRDASGRGVRVYGTNVDVTERKRAEEALRHSQQLLNLVLETLPAGVAVVDRAGDIILSNAAARRIWGEKMIHSGAERWVRSAGYWHASGQKVAPHEWPSVRALRDGRITLNELIDIDAFDGRRKTIQVSAAPIRNVEGLIVGSVFVIDEVTERVRAESALHESASRLQHLSRRLLAVQEEERRHLSRELHDEFGQILATISLHLHAARRAAGEAAGESLGEAVTLLTRAGAQLRTLALELRPRMLETAGLDSTLRWLAGQHQQHTGVTTEVVGHVNGVSGDLAIACFRVVQEALTNVARHAQAQHVRIELAQSDETLELAVRDDGVGFDVPKTLDGAASRGNLGLVGMTERVEILGGALQLDSQPGRGTRIRIVLPLAGPGEAPAATAGTPT